MVGSLALRHPERLPFPIGNPRRGEPGGDFMTLARALTDGRVFYGTSDSGSRLGGTNRDALEGATSGSISYAPVREEG